MPRAARWACACDRPVARVVRVPPPACVRRAARASRTSSALASRAFSHLMIAPASEAISDAALSAALCAACAHGRRGGGIMGQTTRVPPLPPPRGTAPDTDHLRRYNNTSSTATSASCREDGVYMPTHQHDARRLPRCLLLLPHGAPPRSTEHARMGGVWALLLVVCAATLRLLDSCSSFCLAATCSLSATAAKESSRGGR